MGWEHEAETIWKAQELYCVDRLTFDRVADLVGVASSTLKRWAEKYEWRKKREEIVEAEAKIRTNTIKGRAAVLEHLIKATSGKEASQVAFAVSSLETLALKQQELALAGKVPTTADPKEKIVVKDRADAIRALKEAVENKLSFALQNPDNITVATVKDVAQCLDLVNELESTLPKEEKEGGFTPETLERIIRDGLKLPSAKGAKKMDETAADEGGDVSI